MILKPILFILLVASSKGSSFYTMPGPFVETAPGLLIKDEEVVDTWNTMESHGDSASPAIGYYQAVLFHTHAALDRYLQAYEVNGAVLIDVKKGTQGRVEQVPIEKTVIREESVTEGYTVTIEPLEGGTP